MPRAKFWPTGAGESCLDRAAGFGNDSIRSNNGHDAVSRTGCINQTIGRVSLWGEASGCCMRPAITSLLIHNPHKENDNETNPDHSGNAAADRQPRVWAELERGCVEEDGETETASRR